MMTQPPGAAGKNFQSAAEQGLEGLPRIFATACHSFPSTLRASPIHSKGSRVASTSYPIFAYDRGGVVEPSVRAGTETAEPITITVDRK
jgi:hypothetical protein